MAESAWQSIHPVTLRWLERFKEEEDLRARISVQLLLLGEEVLHLREAQRSLGLLELPLSYSAQAGAPVWEEALV